MELARKGPTYNAASPEEKKLRLYGVPSRYWKVTERDIKGVFSITGDKEWKKNAVWQLSANGQQEVVKEILSGDRLKQSKTLLVCGEPTDDMPLAFAACAVKRAIALGLRPRMVNAADDVKRAEMPTDVLIVWNARGDSLSSRIESCRDWFAAHDDTFRMLIIGGTNPFHFLRKFNHHPDLLLYFQGVYGEDD